MTTARGECDYVLGTSDASSSLFWVPHHHHHHHHHRLISPSEMMVRGGGGAAGVLAFLNKVCLLACLSGDAEENGEEAEKEEAQTASAVADN